MTLNFLIAIAAALVFGAVALFVVGLAAARRVDPVATRLRVAGGDATAPWWERRRTRRSGVIERFLMRLAGFLPNAKGGSSLRDGLSEAGYRNANAVSPVPGLEDPAGGAPAAHLLRPHGGLRQSVRRPAPGVRHRARVCRLLPADAVAVGRLQQAQARDPARAARLARPHGRVRRGRAGPGRRAGQGGVGSAARQPRALGRAAHREPGDADRRRRASTPSATSPAAPAWTTSRASWPFSSRPTAWARASPRRCGPSPTRCASDAVSAPRKRLTRPGSRWCSPSCSASPGVARDPARARVHPRVPRAGEHQLVRVRAATRLAWPEPEEAS